MVKRSMFELTAPLATAEALKYFYSGNFLILLVAVAFPVLLLASSVGLLLARRKRRRSRALLVAAVSLALAAVLIVAVSLDAIYIEPRRLVFRKVVIYTDKVQRPVRIVHMSDVQSASVGSYEREVFRRIKELHPDIVFHTGDLLQPGRPATYESELPKISALLRGLKPPMGIYGVIGDTDGWSLKKKIVHIGGMVILSDEEAEVRETGVSIRILGITLNQSRSSDVSKRVKSWLNNAKDNDFTIVLGHNPHFAMGLTDVPVDLCLAGDTHGGQIRLPFIGPITTFGKAPRSWSRGYRSIGLTRLNVSAGIGCMHHSNGLPSIRFNCPPEITVIELRPKEALMPSSPRSGMSNTIRATAGTPESVTSRPSGFLTTAV